MPIVLFWGRNSGDVEVSSESGLGKAEELGSSEGIAGVAMTLYARAKSSMLEAMGPSTPTVEAMLTVGKPLTRLWEGLRPQMPQKEEGMRIEPPPSAPRAMGTRPAPTAYPEPPDEPPQ